MWYIIKNGLILMFLTLVAGALLAFVHVETAPIIEFHKQAAAGESVMAELLTNMSGGFEPQGVGSEFPYWIGYKDSGKKKPGGYIFITSGKGYSSTIKVMVGVDADFKITGVKILSQEETPGLGDKIMEIRPRESDPWFTRQFIGKSVSDDIRVKKDSGIIDAISGATISSRAVAGAIDKGLKWLTAVLKNEPFTPPEEPAVTTPEEEKKEEAPVIMPNDDVLAGVLPDMAGGYVLKGEGRDFPYWIGYRDPGKSKPGGHLFIARGKGFASTIQTLVGLNADGKIVGIKILYQKETEKYGDRILEIRKGEKDPWFPRQFLGKSASDTIRLKKDGGTIDGITSATITSRAFTESLDTGLKRLMAVLSGKKFIPPAEPAVTTPEEEKKEEAPVIMPKDDVLAGVLSGMAGGYVLKDKGSDFPYWIAYSDTGKSKPGGYLFISRGEGFASTIETLVGVDPDGKVVGIKILYQEETKEYGDRILEIREGEKDPWFPRQFLGKSASDSIRLKKDGGTIDGITSATITSRAFTASLDTGLKRLMAVLSGKTFIPPAEPAKKPTASSESGDETEKKSKRINPEDALAVVLPDMAGGYVLKGEGSDFPYWIGYRDPGKSKPGGYLFIARGEGFASIIETLVGVDPDGKIVGIKILYQEETEEFGDKILEIREGEKDPWFPRQFLGKSASDIMKLKKDGGTIDGITSATITSRAFTVSIDTGLKKLMDILGN